MTKPKGAKPASKARGAAKPPPKAPGKAQDPTKPLANTRHEQFCHLVLQGMAAGPAYEAVGFKTRNENTRNAAASRLLTEVNVAARLGFLKSQAAERAIDAAAMTKADVLRMTVEQHQRNIGALPVTHKIIPKTGKGKGKVVEVTVTEYDPKAASQTLKLLHEEFGLGQGASGARGSIEDDLAARAGEADPKVAEDLAALKSTRKLVLAGGTDVEKKPAVDGAKALAALTKGAKA